MAVRMAQALGRSNCGIARFRGTTYDDGMTEVAEKLDHRLRQWDAAKAAVVERSVAEIIDWGDTDAPDLMSSREREQEVLDLLDEA